MVSSFPVDILSKIPVSSPGYEPIQNLIYFCIRSDMRHSSFKLPDSYLLKEYDSLNSFLFPFQAFT